MAILYFSGLLLYGYARYKKSLVELPKKDDSLSDGDEIILDYNETADFIDYDGLLSKQLYCLLSNEGKEFAKKGYTYQVALDGEDLVTQKKKLDFLYVCRKDHFPPDVKAGHFLSLLMDLAKTPIEERERIAAEYGIHGIANKKVRELDTESFGSLVMAMLHIRPFGIYFIDDAAKGFSSERVTQLQKILDGLKQANNALVLNLSSDSPYNELQSGGKNGKRKYFLQIN